MQGRGYARLSSEAEFAKATLELELIYHYEEDDTDYPAGYYYTPYSE